MSEFIDHPLPSERLHHFDDTMLRDLVAHPEIRFHKTECAEVPANSRSFSHCGPSHQNRTTSRIFMGYFATIPDKNASRLCGQNYSNKNRSNWTKNLQWRRAEMNRMRVWSQRCKYRDVRMPGSRMIEMLAQCPSSLLAHLLERTRHVATIAGAAERTVVYIILLVARIAVSGLRDFANVLGDVASMAIEAAVCPRQGVACLLVVIKAP
jgi:hypothetical protein